MKILFAFLLTLNSFAAIRAVYNTQTRDYIEYERFITQLPDAGHIVLGEFHNIKEIQSAQAKIIKDKIKAEDAYSTAQIMWEFINFTDQENINSTYQQFLKRSISAEEFVTKISGKQNISYTPILELTALTGRAPIALNLPREIKKQAMEGGIDSIDPIFVPSHHYLGGDDYLSRFREAMGGHAPEDMIQKYFLAQCLTDSVMSDKANTSHLGLSFIIAGSFHTDFYDGTVARLKKISSEQVTTIKLTNTEMFQEDFLLENQNYGFYADFIVITD
ncbi:ChaN family lipoprotein [Halobacteriovorax sp. HLS]|uniref:ChaN family lipoprotein n=1 Tax=Halobacteriovorax sp. HLS TaxID=2234000 RepID=UPI000FD940A9|nr:ChaN family lipoprotein [Halobacteriovorax sp. HLS]